MTLQRGDVVLLRRHSRAVLGQDAAMLIVQNDTNNTRMANTIVVYITSNTSRSGEPTQILIDVNQTDGRQSGLKQNSVVSCENILTVVQADILRTIGHLPDNLMQRVDQALKVSLALP